MDEKSRILVVDDDSTLLDIAEEVLGGIYEVMLAISGRQALQILKDGNVPELILLDIDMPEMNGYETLDHIRQIPVFASIPVIFLTGITDSKAELRGLELGAQDYITKPIIKENLLVRLQLRLKEGKRVRQLQMMKEQLKEANFDGDRFHVLTKELMPRERDVVRLIMLGCSNHEIAQKLNYSPGYIKNLTSNIYIKLGLNNRGELRTLFLKKE